MQMIPIIRQYTANHTNLPFFTSSIIHLQARQPTKNEAMKPISNGMAPMLLAAEAAASKANEKGFSWQGRDTTGAPETATLNAVLTAAYLPALGGASTGLNSLCTAAVLQGLRLRRKATGVGTVTRYDLDGAMVANTWLAMESRTYWDLETKELVLEGSAPFAGELMVVG